MQMYRINGYILYDEIRAELDPSRTFNTLYDAVRFRDELIKMFGRQLVELYIEKRGTGEDWHKA